MNVSLFFTEPRLNEDGSVVKVQTPLGVRPGVACMGSYSCRVPSEQLASFKDQVVRNGGKLEAESEELLRYSFYGEHVCALVDSLATPFMNH